MDNTVQTLRDKVLEHGSDFQTPQPVAKYMVSLLPESAVNILEPTPGHGLIVKELHKAGKKVTAPDDYFLLDKSQWFDYIVMNPPFSANYAFLENADAGYSKKGMRLGYEILKECMNMSDGIIALMPWFTISDSDVRLRFLNSFGMVSITALPRSTFKYARIQTCVLHLLRGYTGTTQFIVYEATCKSKTQIDIFNQQKV